MLGRHTAKATRPLFGEGTLFDSPKVVQGNPIFVNGLYAVQRPRIGRHGLVGAVASAYAVTHLGRAITARQSTGLPALARRIERSDVDLSLGRDRRIIQLYLVETDLIEPEFTAAASAGRVVWWLARIEPSAFAANPVSSHDAASFMATMTPPPSRFHLHHATHPTPVLET